MRIRAKTQPLSHSRDAQEEASDRNTVEMVLSPAEVVFLKTVVAHSTTAQASDTQTLHLKLERAAVHGGTWGNARIVVDVNETELSWLRRITRQIYSFITEEERRARLVLREKLLVSTQRLCAKLTAGQDSQLRSRSHGVR